MQLERIELQQLFGRFDYDISLKRPEKITIIHAPNGFGKTAVLTMVYDFFSRNLTAFLKYKFRLLRLSFDNGEVINITRLQETAGEGRPSVIEIRSNTERAEIVFPPSWNNMPELSDFVPFLEPMGNERWLDSNADEIITRTEAIRRYSSSFPPAYRQGIEIPAWVLAFTEQTDCRLIETQRLLRIGPVGPNARMHRRTGSQAVVDAEARDLAQRIGANLVNYASSSQRLDQSFPKRLLDALNSYHPPSAEEAVLRLQKIETKRTVLIEAGLMDKAGAPELLSLAELENLEVRKVIGVYLDDMEDKLAKFDQLFERISLFQELVSEKFQFKKLAVSRKEGISVVSDDDQTIPLTGLSSGEQHELVLLYELLFRIKDDALILIDEPELSLHVGWQIRFLPDLQRIQRVKPLQVVMATHSPQIINDRWDLTVELGR